MKFWTTFQIEMLRTLAAKKLSGQQIAWQINVAYGTFYSADAVRRRASLSGITLRGKAGGVPGNRNAHPERQVRDRFGRFIRNDQKATGD